jgi:hypothetical protein
MATDLSQKPMSQLVDLTGLPEPVVQDIRRLVETLRVKLGSGEVGPPRMGHRPLRGLFAEPGLSIPKEEIDQAQREAWAGFPREFPESPTGS